MKHIIATTLMFFMVFSAAFAQQSPDFSGSAVTFDYGTCTNSAGVTCTATTLNNYGANAQCIASDTSTTNIVNTICSISGNTVTVTNAPTTIAGTCSTSAATSCTWTAPYTVSSSVRCIAGSTTTTTTYAHCLLSGTTVTVTLAASATDTWQTVLLLSSPSATNHIFQYIVWQ